MGASDVTIYAHCTVNSYTLTYNGNNCGTPSPTTKTLNYGATYGTLPTISKTGYTQNGWYTATTGGSQVSTSTTMGDGNTTIYARCSANGYTLTYDNQGGSGCTTKAGTYDSTWGALCTPTRTGYVFGGWYTATGGGGSQVTASTTVTGSLTVYAKWTVKKVTVNFHGDTDVSKTYTYGVASQKFNSGLTKTGYYGSGWSVTSGSTTKTYEWENGISDTWINNACGDNATATVDLYAIWTKQQYTLTFNGNGCGTPNPTSKVILYNDSYGTLASISQSGYEQDGWYTASSGGSQVTSATTISSENRTVYAHCHVNEFTLTYDNQSGSGCTSKTGIYNNAWGDLCTPTRSNYTFKGWYTGTGGGGSQVTASTTVGGNLTVYAKWEAIPKLSDKIVKVSNSAPSCNGLYYYAGSNTQVTNNYICFGSSSCTNGSNNMYRILGYTKGSDGNPKYLKLVKQKYASNQLTWNGTAASENNTFFYKSNISGYLNNTFYNSFSATWKNMIVNANGTDGLYFYESRMSNVQNYNQQTSNLCAFEGSNETGYVHLLTASDIYYSRYGNITNGSSSVAYFYFNSDSWVLSDNVDTEWTACFRGALKNSSGAVYGVYGYVVSSNNGAFTDSLGDVNGSNNYRPVFYIDATNLYFLQGDGSSNNPFIIKT